MTGAAQVLSHQLQAMPVGQRQRRIDVAICDVVHLLVVALRRKHLAAAKQLDLIFLRKRPAGQRMANKHLHRFISVFAVQWLTLANTSWQHEVAHTTDTPPRVPERDCYARAQ